MSYRDGEAVVREMLAGKRADALSRARSLGYAQRSVLEERAVADVEALHDRTMSALLDEVTGTSEAQAAIAKVDELIAAYDALLARSAAVLVAAPLDVEAAFAVPDGWRGTIEGAARLAREMRFDVDAVERFEVLAKAVGIAAGHWALIVGLDETDDPTWVEGRIVVAVPPAVPWVSMRRESGPDGMMQDLGVKTEIETADPRFDDQYWIEGNREAAFAVATPLVRRVMIDLGDHGGRLEVGGGLARLSWAGPWSTLGSSGVPANIVPAIIELRASFCE